jgi:hypothetical protein
LLEQSAKSKGKPVKKAKEKEEPKTRGRSITKK